MNYLKNKTKNCKLLLLASSFVLFSSMAVTANHTKTTETNAYTDRAYIAIDSSSGIGYLSSTLQDFMMMTNYFCDFDLSIERTATIFLQDEYQGSESYLSDIKTIVIVDEVKLSDCSYLFSGLENLEQIINIDNLNVAPSVSFKRMFDETPKLKTIDFKDFDVSSCGDLSEMFAGSSFESLDLSNFNTSSCANFDYMFHGCSDIASLDLSSFDTKDAFSMRGMFHGCANLQYLDISSFDLSESPFTEDFFHGTKPKIIVAPKCVPEYHTHGDNVINFYLPLMTSEQFYYYDYDLNNYLDMAPADKSITYYNELDIKNNVVRYARNSLTLLEQLEDVSSPDVDDLRSTWKTISESDFLQSFDEEDCNAMLTILQKCKADTINEEVSNFLTIYDSLYQNYSHGLVGYGGDFLNRFPNALQPDGLVHLGVNTSTNTAYISQIDSYEILKSDLKTKVDLDNVSFVDSIFSLLGSVEYEDITKIVIQDEITIPDCANLFKGLNKVVSIEGMENLNTESIVSCASMFEDCSSLETIDLTYLHTNNVSNTEKMFKNCSSLAEIKSLAFTSKSLVSMPEMFYGCENLVLLDLSNFDLTNVRNTVDCFNYATFLYLKTPKAMPIITTCDLNLYFPFNNPNFAYYDKAFQTYEKLPKENSSALIISTIGKAVLDNVCKSFNQDCEYYCVADGSTSEQNLIRLWETQSEEFSDHITGTINECLMEFFQQDNSSSFDTVLRAFSEKYDYIYGKYQTLLDEHGGDFAHRTNLIHFLNKLPLNSFINSTNETTVAMLSIISTVGVGLVLFFISRKKHIV